MTIGYSGTPLAKKLSLKDGRRVWLEIGYPKRTEVAVIPLALNLSKGASRIGALRQAQAN